MQYVCIGTNAMSAIRPYSHVTVPGRSRQFDALMLRYRPMLNDNKHYLDLNQHGYNAKKQCSL